MSLGVRKIRLTGGEPLVRAKLEHLVLRLSQIPNLEDLALTTNGFNLFEKAEVLKKSGLKRVTISLDSLNRERFSQITKSRDLDNVPDANRARAVRPVPRRFLHRRPLGWHLRTG